MGYDGWVVVGTKLDPKQLEKDLKATKQKLREYEREAEKLAKVKVKAEVDLQPYEEAKKIIMEMTDNANKYAYTEAQIVENLKQEEAELKALDEEYSSQLTNLEQINQKISENAKNQSVVTEEIKEMNSNLARAKGFEGINKNIDNIGKSMKKVLNKVARWGLAVFGIRSAYMAVRRAISMVESENESVAGQIKVMTSAVANALLPVVQNVINLIAKLMMYINYIVKQLTGSYLFDFDKAFESAKKNAGSTADSAKEIKKSLAGFDEMNVISDNSSTAGVGGGGGGITKFEDPFRDWQTIEYPEWLDGIVEFGKWVIDNWQLVLDLLIGIKIFIDILTGNWIGLIIDFILLIILHLEDFKAVWDLIVLAWEAFWNWLGNAISDFLGWIADLGASATDIFTEFLLWIYNKLIKPVGKWFSDLWNGIVTGVTKAIDKVKSIFKSIKDFFSGIVSTIIGWFKTIGTKVGDVIGSAFKAVVNGVLKAIENILNSPIRTINKLITTINKIPGINLGKLSTFSLPRLAVGGIVNMPGKGVPVGGAIAGEVSKEGVIPLTNSQAMQELGQTIGRYITINANIVNTLNGRIISRELQKINTNSDFATNR